MVGISTAETEGGGPPSCNEVQTSSGQAFSLKPATFSSQSGRIIFQSSNCHEHVFSSTGGKTVPYPWKLVLRPDLWKHPFLFCPCKPEVYPTATLSSTHMQATAASPSGHVAFVAVCRRTTSFAAPNPPPLATTASNSFLKGELLNAVFAALS